MRTLTLPRLALLTVTLVATAAITHWLLGGDSKRDGPEHGAAQDDKPLPRSTPGPHLSGSAESPEAVAAARRRRAARTGPGSDQERLPICAYVVDPEGRAVPGVSVTFRDLVLPSAPDDEPAPGREATSEAPQSSGQPAPATIGLAEERVLRFTTDADGGVRGKLPSELWEVSGASDDFVYLVQRDTVFRTRDLPIYITRWPLATVTGTVVNDAGEPIAHADVVALRWDDHIETHISSTRGQAGAVAGACGAGGKRQARREAPTHPRPATLTVLPHPAGFPELWLEDGQSDGFFMNGVVAFRDPDGHPPANTHTDERGRFTLHLPGRTGSLRIAVIPNPFGLTPHAGCRREFLNLPTEPLTLRVSRGRTLEVHVRTGDTKPVAGARVLVIEAPDASKDWQENAVKKEWGWRWEDLGTSAYRAAVTHEDGTARIDGLSEAPYFVAVASTDTTGFSAPILVLPDLPRATVTVPGLGEYLGTVVAANPTSVRVVCTVLPPEPAEAWDPISRHEVVPSANGRYRFTAVQSTRLDVFAFDSTTGASASLQLTETGSSPWLPRAGSFEIQPLTLAPPDSLKLRLHGVTWPGSPISARLELPADAALVMSGRYSGSQQRLQLKEISTATTLRLMKHEEYSFEIHAKDGKTIYEMEVGKGDDSVLDMYPVEKRTQSENGTWESASVVFEASPNEICGGGACGTAAPAQGNACGEAACGVGGKDRGGAACGGGGKSCG